MFDPVPDDIDFGGGDRGRRRAVAATRRWDALRTNLHDHPVNEFPANDDEARFGSDVNYFASYTKGLPHDDDGEVDPEAYETLRAALAGDADFEEVPEPGERPLVNPEASMSFNLTGLDPNDVYSAAPPAFDSAEAAAEMVELYWQSLLRDVDFADYDTDETVAMAAEELSELTAFTGPTENGRVTPRTVFRGDVPGTRTGALRQSVPVQADPAWGAH